ncbi:YihY/virulence factor BrkB family protein [Neoroseomonas alba]|uniref:YihY/virulence factor BrkB family protein n=1 Tax=Roseomonas alba TaxID=2846776 RepID=UPI0021060E2B|nr:YihY/virulence factor BrkB family protein [Neoroseomonas alba]
MAKDALRGFIADECLSRAASIAYFSLFSLSPLLVIAMAIAGAVFGEDAARGAVEEQLRGLLGRDAAEAIQTAIRGAADVGRGTLAGVLGIGMLLLTASGTFGEIQAALNAIWKTETPPQGGISHLLKAKAAAIGLVGATGFLLLTSLIASAAIAALGSWARAWLPGGATLIEVVNIAVSLTLLSLLFGAIYKVLPDRAIAWRDVAIGAVLTAVLFTLGKSAIGLYIGGAGIASSFGAAGSLAVVLVWIYYSALIFLLGAEFTRAFANLEGSRKAKQVPAEMPKAVLAPDAPAKAEAPARVVVQRPAPLGAVAGTLAVVVGVLMLKGSQRG